MVWRLARILALEDKKKKKNPETFRSLLFTVISKYLEIFQVFLF